MEKKKNAVGFRVGLIALRDAVARAARRHAAFMLVVAGLICFGPAALATDPPDASGIVTTATNTFNAVGALIVTVVGFFVIVKIVKWLRK